MNFCIYRGELLEGLSALERRIEATFEAGVSIDLVVRDTCLLRPGIPGLSESIRVVSIVGRFLEHARVYYVQNGGEEEYFIGSADVMSRNLMNRVEIVVPVEAPELREELRFVLDSQLGDKRSAWEMQPDGSYLQRDGGSGKKAKDSHQVLIEWAERFTGLLPQHYLAMQLSHVSTKRRRFALIPCGNRAEEIVAVTDDGWRRLGSGHTDRPGYAR